MIWIKFILSLVIILISCELFTNGIEWLGKKLKLGDGVIGSVFSAIGTCLPETIVPIVALLFSAKTTDMENIGIGAILGAPFMLSTLAFFVTGMSTLIFWKSRKTGLTLNVDNEILSRDIVFFILVYSVAILTSFLKFDFLKMVVACFLLLAYVYYVFITIKRDSVSQGEIDDLYLTKFFGREPGITLIMTQIILALLGIVLGAHFFVGNIDSISNIFGISALVLSLIITPIATELPEKFNSVIWMGKRKDTLAMGNISGAMVFQSCIPVSIGIIATNWNLDNITIASGIIAILSSLFTYIWMKAKGNLSAIPLLCGGLFYIMFILYVF